VFLAEAPLAVGIGLVVWLAVLAATRMVSAASVAAAAVVGVLLLLPLSHIPVEIRVLGCAICAFVIFAHRSNIRRILDGTESRFGGKKTDDAVVGAAALAADAEEPR